MGTPFVGTCAPAPSCDESGADRQSSRRRLGGSSTGARCYQTARRLLSGVVRYPQPVERRRRAVGARAPIVGTRQVTSAIHPRKSSQMPGAVVRDLRPRGADRTAASPAGAGSAQAWQVASLRACGARSTPPEPLPWAARRSVMVSVFLVHRPMRCRIRCSSIPPLPRRSQGGSAMVPSHSTCR